MNRRGMLIVLSGPSGSGKGTIIKSLLQQREDTVLSISVTTRAPRPGEEDGVHYFFRTREEFEELIRRNALLEFAEYNGNYYGTPEEAITGWLNQGKNVLLEIEVQGCQQVMEKCPDALTIFIIPPSMEELEKRIRGRGTEPEEIVQQRLSKANREMELVDQYKFIVCNEDPKLAASIISSTFSSLRYARFPFMPQFFEWNSGVTLYSGSQVVLVQPRIRSSCSPALIASWNAPHS